MQQVFFAALRMMQATRGRRRGVSSLLSLSVAGVALSLMIMLISLAIIQGFDNKVSSIAYNQTGYVSLHTSQGGWMSTTEFVRASDELLDFLKGQEHVTQVLPIIQQGGMIKTEDDYQAVALYGLDSGYRHPFIQSLGEHASDLLWGSTIKNPIILPSQVAKELQLKLGDKVRMYFLGDRVRVRVYHVADIYDSQGLTTMPLLCQATSLRRMLRLEDDQYSRIAVYLDGGVDEVQMAVDLHHKLSELSHLLGSQAFAIQAAPELMPDLFQWLSMLDSNVVFLITIMLIVGAFTMITGVIIIVLDKVKHIGVFKALGMTQGRIRMVFGLMALRLIGRGMLYGNVIALGLCLVQKYGAVIKLDPKSYFMDVVPILIDPWHWLWVNVGTMVFIALAIIAPTIVVAQVSPAQSMRAD